jgi:hypothetical protein
VKETTMVEPFTLVIPSKTRDYLHKLIASLNTFQPGWTCQPEWRVIVADNGLDYDYVMHLTSIGVKTVSVPDPFVFSKAINAGLTLALKGSHIIIMNDDAAFTSLSPLLVAGEVVHRALANNYGLIGTKVNGGVGNRDQTRTDIPFKGFIESAGPICFVCTIIPRPVFDKVGGLDDRFDGYGYEDNDYSLRVLREGYKLGVTSDIVVTHGLDGKPLQSTFSQKYDPAHLGMLSNKNKKKFIEKWGSLAPTAGNLRKCTHAF